MHHPDCKRILRSIVRGTSRCKSADWLIRLCFARSIARGIHVCQSMSSHSECGRILCMSELKHLVRSQPIEAKMGGLGVSQWFGLLHVWSGPCAKAVGPVLPTVRNLCNCISTSYVLLPGSHNELYQYYGTGEECGCDVEAADIATISLSERCYCTCSGDGIRPDARDLICGRIRVRTCLSLDLSSLRGSRNQSLD